MSAPLVGWGGNRCMAGCRADWLLLLFCCLFAAPTGSLGPCPHAFLGWMYWLMGCIFSCGIGQMATCCGEGGGLLVST